MKRKKRLSWVARNQLTGLSFVLPFIIGLVVFFAYPLIQSLRLSVSTITSYSKMTMAFAGLKNYTRAFFEDANFLPWFWSSAQSVLINVPLIVVFSVFIALLLNRNMKGRGIFRVLFFLPIILGTGFVMEQLLGENINQSAMETVKNAVLTPQITAMIGSNISDLISGFLDRITLILWNSGVQIIITLSGLQAISPSLYEAATVDAANAWDTLWFITLPMLAPFILIDIVFSIVNTFNDSSNLVIGYIRDMAFKWNSQYEFSSAMGWIYLTFVLLLVGVSFLIMRPFIRNVSEPIR